VQRNNDSFVKFGQNILHKNATCGFLVVRQRRKIVAGDVSQPLIKLREALLPISIQEAGATSKQNLCKSPGLEEEV
jgi:hypothetical protein